MGQVRRFVSRHIAYPLMATARFVSWRAGLRPMRLFRRFEALARAEPAVWEAFRARQLRIALDNALRHIPYYRPLASRLLSLVEADPMRALGEFPILTKRVMQEHESDLLADWVPPGGRHLYTTGGSTGEPTRFWHDYRRDASRLMSGYRDLAYTGWRPGDPGALIEVPSFMFWNASRLRRALNWLGGNFIGLDVHKMTAETTREFLAGLERHRPVCIRGIASGIDEYAGWLELQGLGDRARSLRLNGIVSSSEMLLPAQRERVERVFGARMFDMYGTNEMSAMAMECSTHEGLHVDADVFVLEILDDQGRPVPRGESGRIVVTDCWNLGYSMIRVDQGDVGRYLPEDGRCPCGVTFPRLAPVEGRTMDFLTLPDGQRVHGLRIAGNLHGFPGLRQFRIVQEARDEIVLLAAGDRPTIEANLPALLRRMPPGVRLRVEHCDDIPLSLRGKRLLVISNVR